MKITTAESAIVSCTLFTMAGCYISTDGGNASLSTYIYGRTHT